MTQKRRKELKELLLEENLVTPEDIAKAEEVQKVSSDSLGNILLRMGAVKKEDLMKTYSKQWNIPYINLEDLKLDLELMKLIPSSIAKKYKLIPISKTDGSLTVAMVDPLNIFVIDELRLLTGLNIEPLFATEDDVINALTHYYGIRLSISELEEQSELEQALVEAHRIGIDQELEDAEIRKLIEEAPIVRLANVIITQAIRDKASDIHIEPHKDSLRIRFRIDGILHEVMRPPKALHPLLTSRIKTMANMDISERRIPQDGRIQLIVEGKEFDFRVSTYPTIFGEKTVIRILDKSGTMIGLEKLGFSSITLALFEDLLDNPYGILLVTGPTGSGKTTTLYSALHKLNTIEKNIITIEDPIEYQLDGINQVQVNEKAGLRFDNGLRHLLRHDPDIIMVGEIRDPPTAEIAINAALTGHLVLSTLHTNDAPGAPPRLIDMGIEAYLVASAVIGVLAQRLVRVICPKCKEAYEVDANILKIYGVEVNKPKVTLYRGKGCDRCRHTGYSGRTGIFEFMYVDDEIRELIVNKASAGRIKEQARKNGMKTLQEDCMDKVMQGITTIEEAARVVYIE